MASTTSTPISNDNVADRTQSYRQEILELAQHSNSEIAWTVSQHMLKILWNSKHRSSFISTPSNVTFCCQDCGNILHPGLCNTHIRTKHPKLLPTKKDANEGAVSKKTLKRREQRRRKQASRQRQMQPKKRLNNVINAANSGNCLVVLDDALEGNPLLDKHLVLTCGRCRGKTILKGPKQPTQEIEKEAAADTRWAVGKRKARDKSDFRKRKNYQDAKPAEIGNFEESFVSLPPVKIGHSQPGVDKSSLSLIEQRLANKKKKRNPKKDQRGGKSNLMNFLSSLNDH